MAAGSVIVNFDVLKQLPAKGSSIHQRGIVVAVASAAHAGDQSMAADQISVLPATVNAATVGVHDYSVVAKIDHHCQIQPALRGTQVGDVTGPLLIRALHPEAYAATLAVTPNGLRSASEQDQLIPLLIDLSRKFD